VRAFAEIRFDDDFAGEERLGAVHHLTRGGWRAAHGFVVVMTRMIIAAAAAGDRQT
jgi:hypothetical protein